MESEQERQRENQSTLYKMLTKISPDLLSEFLFKRGVKVFSCLLCGSEDVVVPQTTINPNEPNAVTYVDAIKVEGGGPLNSLRDYQYRVICSNCGFTHNISVVPVMDWAGILDGGVDE